MTVLGFTSAIDSNDLATSERGESEIIAALDAIGPLELSAYARPSLLRRIRGRAVHLGLPDFAAYCAFVARSPEEYAVLCEALSVPRTAFFRDRTSWQLIEDVVVPELARREEPIRVWSAGCASGEEAFSAAMLFAEAIGRPALPRRLRILASDISTSTLAHVRRAAYPRVRRVEIPAALFARYASTEGGSFVIDRALRASVMPIRQDLLRDPPFCKIDLVMCRNTLIYFTPAAQRRVLARLYLALRPDGVLMLGPADGLVSAPELFDRDPRERQLFRPRPGKRHEAIAIATTRSPRARSLAWDRPRSIRIDSHPVR